MCSAGEEHFERELTAFLRRFERRIGYTFFGFSTVTNETLLTVRKSSHLIIVLIVIHGGISESVVYTRVYIYGIINSLTILGILPNDKLLHRRNSTGQPTEHCRIDVLERLRLTVRVEDACCNKENSNKQTTYDVIEYPAICLLKRISTLL